MLTSEVLSKIKTLQAALSVFSALHFNSNLFPPDSIPYEKDSYDYLIVGGGIAGSVVSARLVEAGFSVLVIEAGSTHNVETYYPGLVTYVKNSRVDWNYTVEQDRNLSGCQKDSSKVIAKVLGGAGAIDYMSYSKGCVPDYDKWSKITNDESWQLKNMQKYFKKSENLQDPDILNSTFKKYHGIGGKITITRDYNAVCDEYIKGYKFAGEPVPLDNIGKPNLGYSRSLYNIDHGIRMDAALAYLSPIRDNHKLNITYNSLATKIIFDEYKNAVGVQILKNGKKVTVKAKKEVIISAGPIKSPQLLMLSGIGCKEELEKFKLPCISNLPVGQNLQNLVGAYLVFKTNKTVNPEPFNAHNVISPVVIGYSAFNKASKYPDYLTWNFIIDDYFVFLSMCGFTLGVENKICDSLNFKGKNTQLLSTYIYNLNVKSKGEILLRSVNPEDSPKIINKYYSNDEDVNAMVNAIQHYMNVVSTPYFKSMGLEFMDPTTKCGHLRKGSKEFWKCYVLCMTAVKGGYVGSNSMGFVVNTEFCVYGVHKLRVVDASVIPTTISGSTFATICAVAEKAAEIIISSQN